MATSTLPAAPAIPAARRWRGRRVVLLIVGCALCLFAVTCLAGGGWALWKDRVDRDGSGYVSLGTSDLRTETYAIVGDLRGDGPAWLYGSNVIGDARVRATSSSTVPLFIGIARKADVSRYLAGAGYATINNFEVTSHTTHSGGPPSNPPEREAIWAVSTQSTGAQTLLWTPRDGDWSIVFMNADAGGGVSVHGDASAKLPPLPWVAGGLLLLAAASGVAGTWIVVRTIRGKSDASSRGLEQSVRSTPDRVPVGAPT